MALFGQEFHDQPKVVVNNVVWVLVLVLGLIQIVVTLVVDDVQKLVFIDLWWWQSRLRRLIVARLDNLDVICPVLRNDI